MQRVAPINALMVRSSRRAYAAAAESTRSSTAATSGVAAPGMVKVAQAAAAAAGAGSPGGKAEIFWMRDPKTGNWIPENRFGEVDVAELRELLLSKK